MTHQHIDSHETRPTFSSLSPEEQERIRTELHAIIDTFFRAYPEDVITVQATISHDVRPWDVLEKPAPSMEDKLQSRFILTIVGKTTLHPIAGILKETSGS